MKITIKKLIFKYYSDNGLISMPLFFITILVSLFLTFLFGQNETSKDIFQEFMSINVSTSATIFAVIIAAFGFYAAMTDITFSKSLLRMGQLENSLFPFLIVSILWTLTIFTSLVFKLANKAFDNMDLIICFYIGMTLLALSLLFTVALIYDTLKLTIYRAYFSDKGVIESLDKFRRESVEINESTMRKMSIFLKFYIVVSIAILLFFVSVIEWRFLSSFLTFFLGMVFLAWNYLTYKSIRYMQKQSYFIGMNVISSTYKVSLYILSLVIATNHFNI
ncbi:hypothetical protein ABH897_004677 [Paenibacillus sp. RC73]|uniref:hypothetical protein n=1 Tax=Paenibacillus sp. RC73 TaxID=3156250 RepID=UPI0038376AD5